MNSQLVSIIIPCYNQAQYLDECLESVFNQSYKNWECIIVNDGSPDNTDEIAQKWLAKDNRFKYIHKENGGLSSARNAGLKIALGTFIQFLDSDDFINKYKLERQLICFKKSIDIVICDYFPFDNETGAFLRRRYMNPFPDKINYKKDIVAKWESELSIPCHCILIKTKLIRDHRILTFDESLPNHEDWVFWVQLFHYSSGIFNLNESLVSYRIHNKSLCFDDVKMKEGFILAAKSNLNFLKSVNDKKGVKLCIEKMRLLENKKKVSIKKTIKLFIPPVIFLLKKKLFN